MSVDVVSRSVIDSQGTSINELQDHSKLQQNISPYHEPGDVLSVWATSTAGVPSIHLLEVDDGEDSQYSSRKPSAVSSIEGQLLDEESKIPSKEANSTSYEDLSRDQYQQHQRAYHAAVHLLGGIMEDNRRKISDPTYTNRREEINKSRVKKERCLSDTSCLMPSMLNYEGEDNMSALGCDSGIVDYSIHHSTTALSEPCHPSSTSHNAEEEEEDNLKESSRKKPMKRAESLDEVKFRHQLGGNSSTTRRRDHLTKHLSLSSVSSDNYSISSYLDAISVNTATTELLSSLGFGEFDSPLLIPDRFIPSDSELAKPSVMLEQTLLGVYPGSGASYSPSEAQVSCSNITAVNQDFQDDFDYSFPHSLSETEDIIPLGGTADNFIHKNKYNRIPSPPQSPIPTEPPLPIDNKVDNSFFPFNRRYVRLETVPEETASDLSPSPRWLSPRVSLDHSFLDLSTGQLGASLNVVNRKRSLPNREGYKMSMESLLSEQDSTVYFSITSYDDDIAKEREEVNLHLPLVEDATMGRRRRKGVHHAPKELLSWLQDQNSLNEDDEELPWPFNERENMRRSLTEYRQRTSRTSSSTLYENYFDPVEDPLEGVFQRRFSINGPLLAPANREQRRLSLPSSASYRHYKSCSPCPPSRGTMLEDTIDEEYNNISSEDEDEKEEIKYQHNTRLPPGMTRENALEYKRQTQTLQTELDIAQEHIQNAQRKHRIEKETHFKKISDTEEWLRSELWTSEKKRREIEEAFERVDREYKMLQQNQQMLVARIRESVKEEKNKEITALKQKLEQKNVEYREKILKLEEECRQLRNKETQLIKKANQQGLKNEKESVLRELALIKEQLRHEKQLSAGAGKEKAVEMKHLRSKAQLEKEEALKNQKEYLTKVHQTELATLRQLVHQPTGEREHLQKPTTTRTYHASSPVKLEVKKLHYQLDKMSEDIHNREEEIASLKTQLHLLHKERLAFEKESVKNKRK